MTNVLCSIKGEKLTIEVDLSTDIGPSKSGKTTLIASSEGNYTIPGTNGVKLGLNVYRPR